MLLLLVLYDVLSLSFFRNIYILSYLLHTITEFANHCEIKKDISSAFRIFMVAQVNDLDIPNGVPFRAKAYLVQMTS